MNHLTIDYCRQSLSVIDRHTSEICLITYQSSLGVYQNALKMAANVELVNRAWAVITDTLSPGVKKVDRQKKF